MERLSCAACSAPHGKEGQLSCKEGQLSCKEGQLSCKEGQLSCYVWQSLLVYTRLLLRLKTNSKQQQQHQQQHQQQQQPLIPVAFKFRAGHSLRPLALWRGVDKGFKQQQQQQQQQQQTASLDSTDLQNRCSVCFQTPGVWRGVQTTSTTTTTTTTTTTQTFIALTYKSCGGYAFRLLSHDEGFRSQQQQQQQQQQQPFVAVAYKLCGETH